jgi:hypothetical protein
MMMGVSRPKFQFVTLDATEILFFAGRFLMSALWILQILLGNMVYADDDEALQDEDVRYHEDINSTCGGSSFAEEVELFFCDWSSAYQ